MGIAARGFKGGTTRTMDNVNEPGKLRAANFSVGRNQDA
jgi:hypothetical protein